MTTTTVSTLEIESLAVAMYSSSDTFERRTAVQRLCTFQNEASSIGQCQTLLEKSTKPEARLLASSSLLKLITSFWNQFSIDQTVDMRNYLLNYLSQSSNRSTHSKFVNTSLIRSVCRLTKLGWSTDQRHRDVCSSVMQFLESSMEHKIMGLQIFQTLVEEMITPINKLLYADNRKISLDFRTKALLDIFKVGLFVLDKVAAATSEFTEDEALTLQTQSIKLISLCLSANHVGTEKDEALEEYGALMIPDSWKSTLCCSSLIDIIHCLLMKSFHPHITECLDALGKVARLRRTMFNDASLRISFLDTLCRYTIQVIEQSNKLLSDADALRAFSQLLSNIKTSYKLSDLSDMLCYSEWLTSAANFTVAMLRVPYQTERATPLLLHFWASITKAVRFLAAQKGVMTLETEDNVITEICRVYIDSRLKSLERIVAQQEEDDFFEPAQLDAHFDTLPVLFRHEYESSYASFAPLFDRLYTDYKGHVMQLQQQTQCSLSNESTRLLHLFECRLAWMIRVVGVVIGRKRFSIVTRKGTDDVEYSRIDACLAFHVFQVFEICKIRSQLQHKQCCYLNFAILSFCDKIREFYCIDVTTNINANKKDNIDAFLQTLSEKVARSMTQTDLVHTMVMTATQTLKAKFNEEQVIEQCIDLLNSLASSCFTAKLMKEVGDINDLLLEHGELSFEFMKLTSNLKLRSQFYSMWARGVLAPSSIASFPDICAPFEQLLRRMSQMSEIDFLSPVVVKVAIPLCYDLVGVLSASKTMFVEKNSFELVFHWLQPYLRVFSCMLKAWHRDGEAASAVLRLFQELVTHIQPPFSNVSPDSIVLVKTVCQAMMTYGESIFKDNMSVTDLYADRLQNLSACMDILTRCLRGDFVNVGVLLLYNDTTVVDLILLTMQLLIQRIPFNELLVHADVSRKYFSLLSVLFEHYFDVIAQLDGSIIRILIQSLFEGLGSTQTTDVQASINSLNHIVSFIVRNEKKRYNRSEAFKRVRKCLDLCPELLPDILDTLLDTALFETGSDIGRMALPILGLILTNQAAFHRYTTKVSTAQIPSLQASTIAAFTALMQDVQPTIGRSNVSSFAANLKVLNQTISELGVNPAL